jgi:hypothetical protein
VTLRFLLLREIILVSWSLVVHTTRTSSSHASLALFPFPSGSSSHLSYPYSEFSTVCPVGCLTWQCWIVFTGQPTSRWELWNRDHIKQTYSYVYCFERKQCASAGPIAKQIRRLFRHLLDLGVGASSLFNLAAHMVAQGEKNAQTSLKGM